MHKSSYILAAIGLSSLVSSGLLADPCGMVPPLYTGPGSAIERIGLQRTYVFFDRGVESFVIRPGFQGKVDNFGMLIPFPTPPEIRKVPDSTFTHIANSVDPPEVVVDLRPMNLFSAGGIGGGGGFGGANQDALGVKRKDQVTVLKQEAVGMYEVAVLAAGSSAALKKWMDQNQYQFPVGMEDVTADYIQQEWCFVAVKTRISEKRRTDPRPGQRSVNPGLPDGGVFDGHVQGLGFRFRTNELVVPMRLSAFNAGELRNVVYLLTRGGQRIRSIPEEYVRRQVSGPQLFRNLTGPLPLRVIGGGERDIPEDQRKQLITQRNPAPHMEAAKILFASDIVVAEGRTNPKSELILAHEKLEKEILQVNERLGLRGPEIDAELLAATRDEQTEFINRGLEVLGMNRQRFTLSVIDGDFPREVIANQNLTFQRYRMAANRNSNRFYDTKLNGPGGSRPGKLISTTAPRQSRQVPAVQQASFVKLGGLAISAMILLTGLLGYSIRNKHHQQITNAVRKN